MRKKYRAIALVMAAAVFCTVPGGCGNAGNAGTGSAEEAVDSAESEEAGTAEAENLDEASAEAVSAKSTEKVRKDSGESAAAATAENDPEENGKTKKKSSATVTAEETAETGETESAEAAETAPAETKSGKGKKKKGAAAKTGSTAAAQTAEEAAAGSTAAADPEDRITFDGESDLEYNARQILEADDTITREGALGVAAYLWQMGFGRMSGYPTISQVDNGKVLTVFDEEGLFYNIFLTPEGKIQQVEDVEGNELISLGTRAGELVKPPVSGADVIALLEEWGNHGGHSEVVSAYNKFAGDYGRSRMSGDDQWCSETVSAAYAVLGAADKIGGMASNGDTYERNARSIGAWVSGGGYIPNTGDILITHDSSGARHTACVVSCDGHTIRTIAGGGSGIHHSSISVGSGRITGFVVPEW